MSEPTASPLLALIQEKGLIDDLQFEEVQSEQGRSGKPMYQILQDFGVMDMAAQLQLQADYIGTEVVGLHDRALTPEILATVPSATARMYQCLPVGLIGSTVQVAFVEPLDPGRVDELGFVIKKDIQLVVADPNAHPKRRSRSIIRTAAAKASRTC